MARGLILFIILISFTVFAQEPFPQGEIARKDVLNQILQELENRPVAYVTNGDPADTLGKDGDTYLDLDTSRFYLKQNGSWVLLGDIWLSPSLFEGKPPLVPPEPLNIVEMEQWLEENI